MKKQECRCARAPRVLWISCILFLLVLAGCTYYNPNTGRYEVDSKKTMMAAGAAAFTGSVIYHETNRNNYRRPPSHHHYPSPHPGPPPGPRPPR